ncbi:MAG: hypothetical protein CHACPFDD_00559 [Phycisphaerae bacterium]|nr:hypothetical protein [Phycisphaerae bacterium]
MQGRITATLFAIAVLFVADAALGQDKPKTRWSSLMNVDLMVDTYANFLVRKYDLTDEQAAFTKELLHAKANDFMGANGQEVRDLLDRMFEVRTGAEMEQDELVDWGKRSLPVYQAAKQFIVAGNSEWREILDERQKAIHDGDVRQMEESFSTTEDQLQRIVTGEMTVDEFRKPRRQRSNDRVVQRPKTQVVSQAEPPVEAAPPDDAAVVSESSAGAPPAARPLRPDRNPNLRTHPGSEPGNPEPQEHVVVVEPPMETPAVEAPPAAVVAHGNRGGRAVSSPPGSSRRMQHQASSTSGPGWESKWDQYVKDFIAKYQLDAGQTQKANDILKDCKDQATRRLARDKSKLESLDAEIAKVTAAKDEKEKGQKLTELTQQRGKLVEAVDEIFEKQLKPRLEKLPTRAQRRAAEAAGPKTTVRGAKGEKTDASKTGHTTRLPVRPKRDAATGQTNQPQPPEPQPPVVEEAVPPPAEGDEGGE